jgi:RNA polymerase sigma-70 factor (ECF subfamily)
VNERELVERVKGGDPDAERVLYERHVDRVYRLAFRMTGDDTLARDLAHDAFVRAFERIGGFRGDCALSTWLHAVTASVVLNGLRKVRRIRDREREMEAAADRGRAPAGVEPDLRRKLRRAVGELPDGYRTVFLMHDVEGYTHEEIGRALGVEAGTSRAQLSRARARLREALAEFEGEWVA